MSTSTNPANRNVRTSGYKAKLAQLPADVQELAEIAYAKFRANPAYPSLNHHELKNKKRSQLRPGSFSVSIDKRYRAIYVVDGDVNVWYWVGSHSEYNTFTGGH